jgi:hypothetical protein
MDEMSFDEMAKLEPSLAKLKDEALSFMANTPGTYWQRSRKWYQELKPRFKELVGFMAESPALRSCEAYETAYRTFVEILKI